MSRDIHYCDCGEEIFGEAIAEIEMPSAGRLRVLEDIAAILTQTK